MLVRLDIRFLLLLAAVLFVLAALPGGVLLAEPAATTQEQSPLPVVYFYSPTCLECKKASESIEAAQRKYGGRVRVVRHSIASTEGLELLLTYEEKYGVSEGAPPRVFVGKHHLGDAPAILARLDAVIDSELAGRPAPPTVAVSQPATGPAPATQPAIALDDPPPPPEPRQAPAALAPAPQYVPVAETKPPVDAAALVPTGVQDPPPGAGLGHRFQSFRVGAIVLAGLVDGVNPCAFTTVVFLLSAVAYLGRTKRDVAIVGIAFTFAVFATYMLLGLGLMLAVKTFAVRTGVSLAVTYAIAALTFILAAWSLFDGVRMVRSGEVPSGTLGLPPSLKAAIRRVIQTGLKTRNLLLGSLVVGFLVSLVESVCTGQVYLPTIMLMLHSQEHSWQALLYLLLYNLMFILPLAIIMVSAYFGVRSEWLGQFLRRHLAALKFILAGLFAGLGLLLLLL